MRFYQHKPLLKIAPKTFTNFVYSLEKKGVTSGGSRLSYKFTRKLPINIQVNRLMYNFKSYSGRTENGRIVMFTKKKKINKTRMYNINYSFRFRAISFIASITILPYSHKLVSLIFSSTGSVSYIPTSFSHTLFKLIRMYRVNKKVLDLKNALDVYNRRRFITQSIFTLKQLPRNQKISLLELLPGEGIKYVRSPGTSGHLIKMNFKLNTAFVRLPSGVRKVFSLLSLGSLGVNPFSDNKY